MSSKIGIIVAREFFERVRKKSFIITTILMPIIMLVFIAVPSLIMMYTEVDTRTLAVVDKSGVIFDELTDNDIVAFRSVDCPVDSARALQDVEGVLFIPANVMNGAPVQLFSNGASSLSLEQDLTSQINKIIETKRLEKYDISNLDQILADVKSNVTLQTIRNDKDSDEQDSALVGFLLGMALTFILYMVLILYGQMVMTSIIEEKNNRVLEIVVSSVRPTELMLGKIFGVCSVVVTQILVWGVILSALSMYVLPLILPDSVATDLATMNAGGDISAMTTDVDLLQAVSLFSNVGYIVELFAFLLLFLVGGFLLYSAIYAAIGSAVDNIQDAGQLQSVIIFPIIIALVVGMAAANDPNSSLAFWTSIFPFTAPVVMMARIPFGIPMWEICLSLVLLFASFLFMVWVAAKIYRVGIFMYGKKPSFKDLYRMIKYK